MTDFVQPIEAMSSTDAVIARQNLTAATSLVDYHSAGHCLIVGDVDTALEIAPLLTGLSVTIVQIDVDAGQLEKRLTDTGIAVFKTPSLQLSGYLGAFLALAGESGGAANTNNLATSMHIEKEAFDLVLDLSAAPLISASLPPFGYAPAADADSLAAAVAALPDMVGEFEKPKYFDYQPEICAHSRSELAGCSNCIDVCATAAISPAGEGVQVIPYLCQGCGSCATVCPSGAMTYAYPKPVDAIARTREMFLKTPRHALLLYSEAAQNSVDGGDLPSEVLPLLVEEVSAFGMDYWASMVCSGIHCILLLSDAGEEDPSRMALTGQVELFHSLLAGLGVHEPVVKLIASSDLAAMHALCARNPKLSALQPANFTTHNDKRQTLRLAFDSLSDQLTPTTSHQPLNSQAPFGRIVVDQAACTLCMACVSVCPAKSLLDGQETPALRQIEANCLQCGLCEQACPESAITLEPRYVYASLAARKIETLNEEAPFHCVICHKAFATSRMIETVLDKLAGHWMFTSDKATRRLKMCEDCRVKDMFEDNGKGIQVHPSGAPPDA